MKNSILNFFFPYRKLRKKDLTQFQKLNIYGEILIQAIINIVILSWIIVPLFILDEPIVYKNLHLHIAPSNKHGNELNYLKKVDNYLKTESLYDDKIEIDIYVINNKVLYGFLSPSEIIRGFKSFAVTTIGSSIVIQFADFNKNKASYNGKDENLDAILAHEIVHVFQNHKYGYLTLRMQSKWLIEGYATYASRNLYIDSPQDVLKDFKTHYSHMPASTHISEKYKTWMLMVKHAIEKMHKSVDDLHQGRVDYDEVLDSLLVEYNITK